MVKNEDFLQFLSNILILNCDRPKVTETTALGAAYLAGLSSGFIKNTEEISKKWQSDKIFKPKLHKKEVKYLYQGWLKAVNKIIVKKRIANKKIFDIYVVCALILKLVILKHLLN